MSDHLCHRCKSASASHVFRYIDDDQERFFLHRRYYEWWLQTTVACPDCVDLSPKDENFIWQPINDYLAFVAMAAL